LFGLLCAWREVLILRQHTFWHRRSDPRAAVRASVETPPYHDGIFVVSTPSPPSAYLRSLPVLVRAMPSRPNLSAPLAMDAVAAEH
jgi:hypothetical protein